MFSGLCFFIDPGSAEFEPFIRKFPDFEPLYKGLKKKSI